MTIYYLYVKTHNKTGLKYLGQTGKNPYEYKGSGIYWKRHLKEHGDDVNTELIAAFDTKEDLRVAGQFWSQKWNIIESEEWANLIEENGDGFVPGISSWNKGKFLTESHKQKISKSHIGKPGFHNQKHSKKSKLKMSLIRKGKPSPHKGKKFPGRTNTGVFKKENIPWNKNKQFNVGRWINNGIFNKRTNANFLPEGFIFGRLYSRRKWPSIP